jgi:hypothetical protein
VRLVARVRQLSDKKRPDHWRSGTLRTAILDAPRKLAGFLI